MVKVEVETSNNQADPTQGLFRTALERGVDVDYVLDPEQRKQLLEDIEQMRVDVERWTTSR